MYLLLLILFIFFLTTFLVKAYNNTKNVMIRRININNNASTNQSLLTILHLSDLHLENISISAEQLYQKLSNEKIDLIALTGDFLDRKRTIPKLIPYLQVLDKLNPTYGIYAVLGNHDYVLKGKDLQTLVNTLTTYNCHVLQNNHETIYVDKHPVNIIGVDDFSTNRSDLTQSFSNLHHGTNLVLTHDPNIVLEMKQFDFDYLLAGHFHGGQICYPKAYHLAKMGKLVKMNMIKGLHTHDGRRFYISEGMGQTGVNIRIGSLPEITLHQFALQNEKAHTHSVS
ncbi:metallophosphoesterase [Gracilibacillus sp. S3-1-1]|uniref:Metallophosphoesterase n=1 Tax=Gracilibacillus pellucidus TaxID=3095368 RepID=A0ACC6M5B5_9BACI|nr:metallophosphoesterase [Gracilibacillus sp. S3-1-1]MDX8046161.1 metallophosphoesterase [Gracilibacillus sp. S3-1-1]